MEAYESWNRAIVNAVVQGVPKEASVYLNIDDRVLGEIGRSLPRLRSSSDITCVEDFLNSIHAQIVQNDTLNLLRIQGKDADGWPRSVGFLATMVLAANHMMNEAHEQHVISEINYLGVTH